MNKFYSYLTIAFIFISTGLIENSKAQTKTEDDLFSVNDFSYLRDTLYTLKPYYIEVNLKTQKGFLYSRTDSVIEFGISSGTDKLLDGVNTKEGLFVIQSMMPKWYSRQFDSTLMLNWMGFNYGIGFHALQSRSYYRHLGKRKSSHGCVRISRETAAELYSKIELGTPILVHSGEGAVTISFVDSSDNFTYYDSGKLIEKIKSRYKNLYTNRYFLDNDEKLIVDYSNVSHPGLPIGEKNKIPKRQILKPVSRYISVVTPVSKGVMMIVKPDMLTFQSSMLK